MPCLFLVIYLFISCLYPHLHNLILHFLFSICLFPSFCYFCPLLSHLFGILRMTDSPLFALILLVLCPYFLISSSPFSFPFLHFLSFLRCYLRLSLLSHLWNLAYDWLSLVLLILPCAIALFSYLTLLFLFSFPLFPVLPSLLSSPFLVISSVRNLEYNWMKLILPWSLTHPPLFHSYFST